MSSEPTLVLDAVTRVFRSRRSTVVAVSNATLQVHPGEIVAIAGPSGSGKTTLLSLAGCLLTPTSGRITILGHETASLGRTRQAQFRLHHIGFVFQSFNLLPALSCQENVTLPMLIAGVASGAARRRAHQLLELLELEGRGSVRPNDLSGGEQQRLAIARALANHPELILADEPTASLDSATGHRVMELMRRAVEAGEARSLVVVTHDARILDIAHRVLRMEDGVLRAGGPGAPAAPGQTQP